MSTRKDADERSFDVKQSHVSIQTNVRLYRRKNRIFAAGFYIQ